MLFWCAAPKYACLSLYLYLNLSLYISSFTLSISFAYFSLHFVAFLWFLRVFVVIIMSATSVTTCHLPPSYLPSCSSAPHLPISFLCNENFHRNSVVAKVLLLPICFWLWLLASHGLQQCNACNHCMPQSGVAFFWRSLLINYSATTIFSFQSSKFLQILWLHLLSNKFYWIMEVLRELYDITRFENLTLCYGAKCLYDFLIFWLKYNSRIFIFLLVDCLSK